MPGQSPPAHHQRPSAWFVAAALAFAVACAEDGSIYSEANRAVDAVHAVLVTHQVCASVPACRDSGVVRFEAGRGAAWVNVHTALDRTVVGEIADSCQRIAHTDPRRAAIELSVVGNVGAPGLVRYWRRRFEPE